ncbi:MAG: hypothetical protein GEU87_02375 [Alphaproteobacteria bacterium]|nr:hypothetical protein [Alphaproteobacteria bacterium]
MSGINVQGMAEAFADSDHDRILIGPAMIYERSNGSDDYWGVSAIHTDRYGYPRLIMIEMGPVSLRDQEFDHPLLNAADAVWCIEDANALTAKDAKGMRAGFISGCKKIFRYAELFEKHDTQVLAAAAARWGGEFIQLRDDAMKELAERENRPEQFVDEIQEDEPQEDENRPNHRTGNDTEFDNDRAR